MEVYTLGTEGKEASDCCCSEHDTCFVSLTGILLLLIKQMLNQWSKETKKLTVARPNLLGMEKMHIIRVMGGEGKRSKFEFQLCPKCLSCPILSVLICIMGVLKIHYRGHHPRFQLLDKNPNAIMEIDATVQMKDICKLQSTEEIREDCLISSIGRDPPCHGLLQHPLLTLWLHLQPPHLHFSLWREGSGNLPKEQVSSSCSI